MIGEKFWSVHIFMGQSYDHPGNHSDYKHHLDPVSRWSMYSVPLMKTKAYLTEAVRSGLTCMVVSSASSCCSSFSSCSPTRLSKVSLCSARDVLISSCLHLQTPPHMNQTAASQHVWALGGLASVTGRYGD